MPEAVRIDELIRALPKVELHVHLEGCVEPEMSFEFARRNRVEYPYASVDAARADLRFDDLGSFIAKMATHTATLRSADDYYDVTAAFLRRVHAENVEHVELAFSPQGAMTRGIAAEATVDAVHAAFSDATAQFGITGGAIVGIVRQRPIEEAWSMLEKLASRRDKVLALGLHGMERGHPPALFVEHFRFASDLGWRTVAHAGEEGPADYVRQAMDILNVDRIDHGVMAEGDDRLLTELAERAIPLTVCPVSNVLLHVFPTLKEHNAARLLRRGLAVSVHSDDPAYFGGYLTSHMEQTAWALELDAGEIMQLQRNAIGAAFISPDRRDALLAESERVYTRSNPQQTSPTN